MTKRKIGLVLLAVVILGVTAGPYLYAALMRSTDQSGAGYVFFVFPVLILMGLAGLLLTIISFLRH